MTDIEAYDDYCEMGGNPDDGAICDDCGEPDTIGCDPSCPAEGRRLQEYMESEAAHSIGLAMYNAARLEPPEPSTP